MKLNYVRRFSAYVSTFYHSEYITLEQFIPGKGPQLDCVMAQKGTNPLDPHFTICLCIELFERRDYCSKCADCGYG